MIQTVLEEWGESESFAKAHHYDIILWQVRHGEFVVGGEFRRLTAPIFLSSHSPAYCVEVRHNPNLTHTLSLALYHSLPSAIPDTNTV